MLSSSNEDTRARWTNFANIRTQSDFAQFRGQPGICTNRVQKFRLCHIRRIPWRRTSTRGDLFSAFGSHSQCSSILTFEGEMYYNWISEINSSIPLFCVVEILFVDVSCALGELIYTRYLVIVWFICTVSETYFIRCFLDCWVVISIGFQHWFIDCILCFWRH